MSQLLRVAQAGTVESSDILIVLSPAEPGSGIRIELLSPTIKQYGAQIRNVIENVLTTYEIKDAQVNANDKGALDCTVQARLTTAILRATVAGGQIK